MKIQYSHHIFSTQTVGGISNYFIDLLKTLPAPGTETELNFPLTLTQSLNNLDCYSGRVLPQRFMRRGITWRLANAVNVSHEMGARFLTRPRSETDVYHRTYYSTTGNISFAPEVVTVYDMIHEDFPKYFRKPVLEQKLESLRVATEVICISEYTRSRLLELTDIDSSKVTVVPLGIDHPNMPVDSKRPSGGRPYIAYIGTRSGYKNFEVLASAFSELIRIFGDLDLMLVGGGPISTTESELFGSLQITPNILKVDHVENTSDLIRNAQCVVSTSFAEGFGLVPLESLSQGIPCVVSDIEVNREIWGDSLPLFAASDHIKLAMCIQELLESDSHWKSVSENGMAVARTLTAQPMADSTNAVYHRAVAKKNR